MENSAPSLKIFRTKFLTCMLFWPLCKIVEINIGGKNPIWEFTQTIIPFDLFRYEVIITNSRYARVGYLSLHIQRGLME